VHFRFRVCVCVIFGSQWNVCCVDRIVTKPSVDCEAVTGNYLQRVITQLGEI
jgi:hypothetical protein